jgi:hypothetical protein
MNGFPGQLTALPLNACQTLSWQSVVPFYLKQFFTATVRRVGMFIGDEP